ncbi:MAG TPA: tectonin domain-containing protein, partial [Rhodothermales bacterium]|nr:tectonin domain-containing protein [Rhodothermales bacterium]
TSAVSGGKNILQWSASTNSWTAVDGGLVQISVGPDGLWGVNDSNTIYRRRSGIWEVVPGSAAAVAIGPAGDVWALGAGSVGGGHPVMKR